MLERVRQNVRRLVNQATPRHIHTNPFGKALDKPDDIVDELNPGMVNIAKSLVELQKGTFSIAIDGDLFKVGFVLPRTE